MFLCSKKKKTISKFIKETFGIKKIIKFDILDFDTFLGYLS